MVAIMRLPSRFTVVRFTNEAILHDIQAVMQEINKILLIMK